MALIGTIRKNGWILIVLMSLALGGFILMEIISNAQRNSAGDANTLGKVNGQEIRRVDFERYQQLIYSQADASSSYQVREQAWKFFSERALVEQQADQLGLGICRDELRDLEFGANISPLIRERYKNQADGSVNMNYLNQVKNAIDAGQLVDQQQYPFRSAWIEQEHEVVKERLQDKIINAVSKGLYTPTWQAEMVYHETNERLDFAYVRVGYDKVKDEEAPLTDADYTSFLKDNPHLYDQPDESRVISYVTYNVVPTTADTAANRGQVAKLVAGFREAKSDSTFVTSNGGKWDETFKKKSGLPAVVADTLLHQPVGSVIGPYLDGGSWTIAKIVDRKVIPDSVKARHILIKGGTAAIEHTIDSLKNLIKSGKARFDSLAIRNSQDVGSGAKGGDLGWFAEGRMVAEFNNVCFYQGEEGKVYKVKSQFGWHLIEITGKKFLKSETGVKAEYLTQRVEPSKATQQAFKDKAVALVQVCKSLTDLTTQASQQNLSIQNSKSLKANDYTVEGLGTGNDTREVVRWAFDEKTKENTISKEVFSFRDATGGYFDSKYVVAGLKNIAPKGSATIATLKALPEAETKIRNRKKGEILKGKITQVSDLAALATQWGTKIDTARGTTMMQGAGEPRVIGTLFSMAKDAISPALPGIGGVYVIKPLTEKPQAQVPADLTLFRRQVSSSAVTTIKPNLLEALKKQADIRDNRSRFF
jgi:peptidyl-prolyl cis-trans isomerase D